MGQTLSVPATDKKSESGGDSRYAYAMSEMQGWRITMEDAHTVVLNLEEGIPDSNAFFAVYDGHGGYAASKFAGQRVHTRLVEEEAYQAKDWPTALKAAFLQTDVELRADPGHLRDPSGCTAVAVLATNDGRLFAANAGDSRTVLSVKGEVKPLSYDHKPQSDTEKARILAAGGYVEYGRVNGNLALSRALGDFEYKKNPQLSPETQIITANPDIIEHKLTDDDEFLVLACDGIWDCLTSQQVVDIVRRQVAEGKPLQEICEFLCDHCLAPDTNSGAGIGCDNMTVLIVALLNGRTSEEWYAWVADRVKQKYGYDTPVEIPQIFATSRLMAFRARRQAQQERDARDRERQQGQGGPMGSGVSGLLSSSGLGGFARVLGSSGGITFQPGSDADTGNLMFDKYDDSDEGDGSDDEMDLEAGDGSVFVDSFPDGDDTPKSLRAQLAELDKQPDGAADGADHPPVAALSVPPPASLAVSSGPIPEKLQSELKFPPAPNRSSNVDGAIKAVAQLTTEPKGDAPHPVMQVEGLLDKSEDPLKA